MVFVILFPLSAVDTNVDSEHCPWCVDCRNAKANFHFERTVRYRKSNDEDQELLDF